MPGDGVCAPITAPRILWHADSYPVPGTYLEKIGGREVEYLGKYGILVSEEPAAGDETRRKAVHHHLGLPGGQPSLGLHRKHHVAQLRILVCTRANAFLVFCFVRTETMRAIHGNKQNYRTFCLSYSRGTQVQNRQKQKRKNSCLTSCKASSQLLVLPTSAHTSGTKQNAVRHASEQQKTNGLKEHVQNTKARPGGQHSPRQASATLSRNSHTKRSPATRQRKNRPLCNHTYCRLQQHRCLSTVRESDVLVVHRATKHRWAA